MTVRRDCDELVRLGRVIKTVGGIQQASAAPYLYENSVRERIASNQSEKRAIAAKALELIRDHQTIFIDGGTTNLTLARLIAVQRTGLTILTNSALTCLELSKGNNTIIGIGGEYDPITLSFAGPQADEMAKSFLIDQAFLSTKGFLPEALDGAMPEHIGLLHIDLNAPRAEIAVLERLFDRVLPGGVIVFDDYGWKMFHKQKEAEDDFMRRKGYEILELPTGQGLVAKR